MDYQGNSNKSKEPKKEPIEKNLGKVIKGDVITKPKTLTSRFKGIFFGGDFSSAGQYVLAEVLLPALRNLLVDSVAKGTDKLIYGDSAIRRPSSTTYRPRVQYNNPLVRTPQTLTYLPGQRPVDRWSQATKKPFEDVIVGTKEDADTVIEQMTTVVDQYEVVSVADLYELLGLPSDHTDNKWGWTQLGAIEVRQVREGWRITFPPLEEIE